MRVGSGAGGSGLELLDMPDALLMEIADKP